MSSSARPTSGSRVGFTHEPAGMLHECAVHGNYDAARFLIDAEGWAGYAAKDEQMADSLAAAERQRNEGRRS